MVQVDSPIPFRTFPVVTKEQLKAYADASGDFNPIHLDEEVAKKVGLPGIIAHGMFIAALVAERAVDFIQKESGLENFQLVQFQTRFKAMTHLGDTPSVGGTVRLVTDDLLSLELQAKSQKGEVTILGTAKFRKVS